MYHTFWINHDSVHRWTERVRVGMESSMSENIGATVTYLDVTDGNYGCVTAHLDTKDLLVSEVYPVAKAVKARLDFATSVNPRITESGVQLEIALNEIRYGASLDDSRRARLVDVLRPAYTRKVNASAKVVRNETGRHTQTLVTISVESGESFEGIDAERINGVSGVLRARVTSSSITFSMAKPVADDDKGKITDLIEDVTEQVGAMLTRPITVRDSNPDAALDPANDYQPPAQTASTTAAG